eukprot:148044_1
MARTKQTSLYLGAVLLPFGFGTVLSTPYYAKMFKEISESKARAPILFWSFTELVVGVYIVKDHNKWGNVNEALVSSVGWGMLAEGALFCAIPQQYLSVAWSSINESYLKYMGVAMIALGGYFIKVGLEK